MKQAKVVDTTIDFDLPCIIFSVEANWSYANNLRLHSLDYQEWAKSACLKWLRRRGITRPTMNDLKFNLSRNDKRNYDPGTWTISLSLRKGEEAMLKMYQGVEVE